MNILFLGDSITDCDHCFSPDNLGYGYVKFIHELFVTNLPDSNIRITNGGTDGFTVPRILQKWNLLYSCQSWDIVCILAGINEVGYLMGLPAPDESLINEYIKRSSTAFMELLSSMHNHNVKRIVILTPFLFEQPAYLISWKSTSAKICSIIQELCQDFIHTQPSAYSALSVHSLQNYFDLLVKDFPPHVLSADGIHLTELGHQKLGEYLYQIMSFRVSHDTGLESHPYVV